MDVNDFREHRKMKGSSELIYQKNSKLARSGNSMVPLRIEDFDLIKVLGRGAFGKVREKPNIGHDVREERQQRALRHQITAKRTHP